MSASDPPRYYPDKKDYALALVLTLVVGVLYCYLARREVWYSDVASFATFPAFLAPSHYPGYPFPNQLFYLPHLVGLKPFLAASWLNAFFAAVAVGAFYVGNRFLGIKLVPALGVALAFAFTRVYWDWACLGPEVHTLEVLTASLVLALAFAAMATRDPRFFTAAVFIFALSLGNRNTFVILALVLAVAFFSLRRKPVAATAAAAALGISVYLYVLIRRGAFGDQYPGAAEMTASRFYAELFRVKSYSFLAGAETRSQGFWSYIASNLVFYAKPLVLLLAAAGTVVAVKRKRAVLALTLLAAAAAFLFVYYAYTGTPSEQYLLLPALLLFHLAAFAVDALYRLAPRTKLAAVAASAVILAWPTYNVAANAAEADHHQDRAVAARVREGFRNMTRGAAVIGEHWVLMPHAYARFVEGVRPDLSFYSVNVNTWRVATYKIVQGRSGYFGLPDAPLVKRDLSRGGYLVNNFRTHLFDRSLKTTYLPGSFFRREVARLPEGGRFVAVVGDAVPLFLFNAVNVGGWQAFQWEEPVRRFTTRFRLGMGVFVAGKRRGGDVVLYAAKKWGAANGNFECPAALAPPPATPIYFSFYGDAPYGLSGLSLSANGRTYRSSSTGVIFLPMTADWRPAGPASYYYACNPADNVIVHIDVAEFSPGPP